jgi:hypothetical protein
LPYTIALVARGRDVLNRMKPDDLSSPFVFTTLRGSHYTPTSRIHHWNRVRSAAGLGNTSLYLATRHYGHPDKARARRKIREAHDRAGSVTPLRLVQGGAG